MKNSDIDNDFLAALNLESLTKSNWSQFVQLFGDKSPCGNCWGMYYRLRKVILTRAK